MKKLLFFFGFLFFTVFTQAQIVSIPDVNFKNKLLNYTPAIDTNSDGEIQVSEALFVTTLDLSYGNISNATGITSFANLQSLNFRSNQFTALNVSSLTNLQSLDCGNCYQLAALNVTGLTNLQTLNCSYCDLSTLDITGLNLANFNCSGTFLTSLVLTSMTNLQILNCTDCSYLATLNVSGLTNLQSLECSFCRINNLNTTGANNITNLNCSNNNLSSLVVTNMTNLQNLNCEHQEIVGIETLDLTGLNALTTLFCSRNNITALNVANLINLTNLNCGENLIPSLALTNLTNLTNLSCASNQLATLDVTTLTNLTTLDCRSNQLTSLNVTPLINLTSLDCSANQLAALNVSTLIHLTSLSCSYNPIGSLDVSALTHLTYLSCYQNNLTSLDVTNLVSLQSLLCGFNQLTSLNLQNQSNLEDIRCNGNLFTTLDLSNMGTAYNNFGGHNINVSNNPNLTYINLKNDALTQSLSFLDSFNAISCPSLQYICTNENSVLSVINQLQFQDGSGNSTISYNVQVNSYCSFVPAGNYNTITGNVKFDVNNNGCDTNDIPINEVKLFINDGINTGAAFTNATGDYSFYTLAGSFVITPNSENPFFTFSPTSATLTFADNNNNTQTQNFCITSVGVHNDLEIVIITITPARPGFDATYRLVYKNKGNQVQSGSINLYFNDAVLDFVSANPMTTSQTLNNLNWDFTNLNPFETRTIDFVLNVNSPMETPPVNIGDILHFTATAYPIQDDETNEDNIFNLNQIVIGSFDPNDKTCLEGNAITPEMVGDYLHYVIRFQNSGTAAAQNIVVKDMIDTAKFDINTFQLTSSSHPNVARITGNKVEFIFENINLPAEVDNEPGSHGYVAFKIKSKSNLVLGNTIQNTANIYFDYNFPIVTNTTSTIVAVLHVNEFDNNTVSVSPIPVKDLLQIKALETITMVQLFDIQGRLLQTNVANSTDTTLDFSGKSKGVYLVKVQTEKGIKVQKVIKE